MGGGLLQLVAYGAQDAYISGNPQITFWKGLFKRHTNFAMEPFRINFSGQIQWGTKQTALIGRHADLLYSTYVEVVLPGTTGNTPYYWNNDNFSLGYNLIKHVELDIGGQIIDRMYSEFMVLWGALTLPYDSRFKLNAMLGGQYDSRDGPINFPDTSICGTDGRKKKLNVLYIPLPFFFTRNPGAALPLIALQYHEVKINVLWNEPQFIAGNFTKDNLTVPVQGTPRTLPGIQYLPQAIQAALYIDYIYLDTEERRRMAQASHEYLIEQTQFNEDKGIVGASNRIDLTFNHPVKELIWVVQPAYYTDCRLAAGAYKIRPTSYPVFNNNEILPSSSVSIGGQGAIFYLSISALNVCTVTITNGGSGYVDGDSFTFNGEYNLTDTSSRMNTVTFTNFTFTIGQNGSGVINSVNPPTGTSITSTTSQEARTRLTPFTYDIDPVFDQWIQINGQDRLDRRYGDYYNKVQAFQHHSGIPAGLGMYSYSFAIRPEEHQPSGTCNFSRIDTATIVMNMAGVTDPDSDNPTFNDNPDFNNWNVRVYAVNYNVLRVMSGMGGLAYSN